MSREKKSSNFSKAGALAIGLALTGGLATSAQANLIVKANANTKATNTHDTSADFQGTIGNFTATLAETGYLDLHKGDLLDSTTALLYFPTSNKGGNTMTVAFTESNLTEPARAKLDVIFSGNVTDAVVTRTFYLDPTNHGLKTIDLGSITTKCGGTCLSDASFLDPEHLTGSFSLTEFISMKALGKGAQLSADDNVSFVVPEPGALALLGAGLIGAGLFGRRRKEKAA